MRFAFIIAASTTLLAPLQGQSPCKLEGVWQLVSGTADGKPYVAGSRSMKIITKGHFSVVWHEDGAPKEVKTVSDSLAAYRHLGGGGGSYTLRASTYIETIEYFSDPAMVGQTVSFTCRTEGDRFYQSGLFPVLEGGKKVRDSKLEEVWRRIE